MTRSDELNAIAERLVDQRDEPWPSKINDARLHYWRDKAIDAASKIKALTRSNDTEPTEEMIEAGERAVQDLLRTNQSAPVFLRQQLVTIYKAMSAIKDRGVVP